jgi:hypothetical protein
VDGGAAGGVGGAQKAGGRDLTDPLSLPDPLDHLARALATLTATLEQAAGAKRDHLLGLVGGLQAALEGATARSAPGLPGCRRHPMPSTPRAHPDGWDR